MRSRTGMGLLMILGLARLADAAPPGKPADPKEVESMRIAAFRALLDFAARRPFGPKMPAGTPYCLGLHVSEDATPAILARLADRGYVVKALSECRRRNLFHPWIATESFNRMVVNAITRVSERKAEVDGEAFGAHCIIWITRTRKAWGPAAGGGIGCVS